MIGYVLGSKLIMGFFWRHLLPLQGISHKMPSPAQLTPSARFQLILDREVATTYSKDLIQLQGKLRGLTGQGPPFRWVLLSMSLVRILSIVCAWLQFPPSVVMLLAALQFITAPYSGVVAFCRLMVNCQVQSPV